jgi:predicted ferric reductase
MNPTKKLKWNWGYFLTMIIVAIPMFGWKAWYSFIDLTYWEAIGISFAKIGAFGGLAMFAVSLILSGRYIVFDRLFNGLDKMYTAHRFYGSMGLLLLIIHPVALSLVVTSTPSETASFFFVYDELSILIGAIALYGMIALIAWTILSKASYETFVNVHKFLGLFFVLGSIHAFMAGSIVAESQFLRFYLLALTVLGTVTFISYSLFRDLLHRPLHYKIASVKLLSDGIAEIVLQPRLHTLRFTPGQFTYVCFPEIDSNYHPFSIASGKSDGRLRFAIKQLGDFSTEVADVKVGSKAYVKGPYGGFTFFTNRHKKQLWIAGGIGVTPFMSGARSLRHSNETGKIEMIYASDDKQPYGLTELEKIEQRNPSFNVTHFQKEVFGFVSLATVQEQLKDLHDRAIYVCGPPIMLQTIQKEAKKLGLEKNLIFEEFSY